MQQQQRFTDAQAANGVDYHYYKKEVEKGRSQL